MKKDGFFAKNAKKPPFFDAIFSVILRIYAHFKGIERGNFSKKKGRKSAAEKGIFKVKKGKFAAACAAFTARASGLYFCTEYGIM